MSYFTTMNLPAPTHEKFQELLVRYWGQPDSAISDFEQALQNFFEVRMARTFSNCFTAIALTLVHSTQGRAKSVAIAGLSYRRTADIVLWAGLRPLFVDNTPDTLSMDLDDLRKVLTTSDVGCILFQHPMVHIADIDAYLSVANSYGVPILFDSVESTGGYYHGKRIGRFGIAEAFSLHPSKVINAAEGGVLTFGQETEYMAFLDTLVKFGIVCPKTHRNQLFCLEPVHAVMGLASLEIYEQVRSIHKQQYLRYLSHLRNLRFLELIAYEDSDSPNYKSILVKIKSPYEPCRARLLAYLETFNIGARTYYAPLHGLTQGVGLPNARCLAEQYLILPIGHSVTLEDIDFICKTIAMFEAETLELKDA